MLILHSKIISAPIIELAENTKAGEVFELVIDPNSFAVAAVVPKNQNVFSSESLALSSQDIDEITGREVAILIRDTEAILPVDELPKIKELIAGKYYGVGQVVETTTGKRLGKVFDYLVDGKTMRIEKIYIKNFFSEKIIPSKVVVSYEDGKIIVKDNLAKVKIGSPAISSSVI